MFRSLRVQLESVKVCLRTRRPEKDFEMPQMRTSTFFTLPGVFMPAVSLLFKARVFLIAHHNSSSVLPQFTLMSSAARSSASAGAAHTELVCFLYVVSVISVLFCFVSHFSLFIPFHAVFSSVFPIIFSLTDQGSNAHVQAFNFPWLVFPFVWVHCVTAPWHSLGKRCSILPQKDLPSISLIPQYLTTPYSIHFGKRYRILAKERPFSFSSGTQHVHLPYSPPLDAHCPFLSQNIFFWFLRALNAWLRLFTFYWAHIALFRARKGRSHTLRQCAS